MTGRFTAATLALVLLSPPAAALAQRGTDAAPSRGPGWLPRLSYFDAAYFTDRPPPAAQSEMRARLLELERIVLQVAELARPAGFEIQPIIYPGSRVEADKRLLLVSRYVLMFYNPTKQIAGEGCGCLIINVNAVLGARRSPYADARGDMYFEDDPGPPVPGATHVWGVLSETERSSTTVMFTTGGKSPWKSVTREAFLQAVIEQAEGKSGAQLAEARQAYARTPYEQWLAEAPTRKAQREGVLAATDPAQRAELRAVLEAAERETGALLKAAAAGDRAENARALGTLTEYGDHFRARLAAMSPAERRLAACFDRMDATGHFPFLEPGDRNCVRVLQVDLDFHRPRRSQVEARSITVTIDNIGTGNTPEVRPALWAAFNKLDWAALARLLEPGG